MHESMASMTNILLYATAFILGYIVGKMSVSQQSSVIPTGSVVSITKAQRPRKVVTIDEKKFVTEISTTTLQKKGSELGTQVVVEDDVGASVSKLALLKKK